MTFITLVRQVTLQKHITILTTLAMTNYVKKHLLIKVSNKQLDLAC